jgi:hypothetical protein
MKTRPFDKLTFLHANICSKNLTHLQAWKKFAGEVEGMTKALKKKDLPGALDIYQNSALVALDAYLAQVELPSASEI